MARTDIKVKCGHCGLHYQLHTWNEDWLDNFKPYCPECGQTQAMLIWTEKSPLEIFQAVPGGAEMVQFDPLTAAGDKAGK